MLLAGMLFLPMIWVGLRVFGLSRVQGWLARSHAIGGPPRPRLGLARIAALVTIAGSHAPGPSTCLTRSLLLGWFLRRRGVCSDLRIGVRMNQGALEAHAWVEFEGEPINETSDIAQRFAAFDEPISYKVFS